MNAERKTVNVCAKKRAPMSREQKNLHSARTKVEQVMEYLGATEARNSLEPAC